MKYIKTVFSTLMICMILGVFAGNIPVNAATKTGKVTIKSVENIDTTTQQVMWEKVKSIDGYQIYYKESGGSYKKLAVVGKNKKSYTIKSLDSNKKYFYKIRAYKTIKGKKQYGKFSSPVGKKTTNYLMSLYEPYYVGNYNAQYFMCELYKSPNTFLMAGDNYTNGFTLDSGGCRLIFNLKGKYKKMSFTLGTTDDKDRNLVVLADDETVFSTTVEGLSLPKTYTIDIENASKLEFRDMSDLTSAEYYLGFGDIKLFK